MIKVNIYNNSQIITNSATFHTLGEANSWISNVKPWGHQDEKWVLKCDIDESTIFIDERTVISQEEISQEVSEMQYDLTDPENPIELGEILIKKIIIPQETYQEVLLPKTYSIEILDITEKVEQEKINAESRKYLNETDWYIIREVDEGIPCPQEVKTLRAEHRARITNVL